MTAADKKMWSDYDKAQKSETPKSALDAWARKYDVELKAKNKVVITKSYKGDGPAPTRGTAAAAKDCSDICGIRSFERWDALPGGGKSAMLCTLDSCEYNRELKSWICWYSCVVGIRRQ
jgi:hypothetical protein